MHPLAKCLQKGDGPAFSRKRFSCNVHIVYVCSNTYPWTCTRIVSKQNTFITICREFRTTKYTFYRSVSNTWTSIAGQKMRPYYKSVIIKYLSIHLHWLKHLESMLVSDYNAVLYVDLNKTIRISCRNYSDPENSVTANRWHGTENVKHSNKHFNDDRLPKTKLGLTMRMIY